MVRKQSDLQELQRQIADKIGHLLKDQFLQILTDCRAKE
jgi:hypothetical protein